jgi:membrane protein DedA with SNARE-associated domain/membrane-associated phospholipid phosphatase
MDRVQPYLDYFGSHPDWALLFVFLIAFGEALLIIGLFVPSTVALVGAGVLVGTGHLPFWPVFLATAIGAIAGDQVSYWVGRFYGERLKTIWPLRKYAGLVAKGEDFVRSHGGKSIALGRFVPGVKAVVPGIVGMLGMNQLYFVIVNVTSGVVWAAVHVVPGVFMGQGLAFAGELSGRLFIVLIVLFALLGIAGWIIRLAAAGLTPYLDQFLKHVSTRARTSRSRSIRRFSRLVSPGNPRSALIVFFVAVLALGLLALGYILMSLVIRGAVPNVDISVMTLMREVRNAPADAFLIPLTMLGDLIVLLPLLALAVAWLAWHKAYRAAAASVAAFLIGKLALIAVNRSMQPVNPADYYAGLDPLGFLSGYAGTAAIAIGILAVLASHAMGRWSRAVVYSAASLLVVAIAYSRVYLGVEWFTSALGGLLFGAVVIAGFGVAIEAIPPRRIKPMGLLAVALLIFSVVGYLHISANLARAERIYAAPLRSYELTAEQWRSTAWRTVPLRRIDLAGRTEEPFAIQWAGPLGELEARLAQNGWRTVPKWRWSDSLRYLDTSAQLADLAPRPALHEGLKAQLTMTRPTDGQSNAREVMRAYKTDAVILTPRGLRPLFLISLTRESLRRQLHAYAIPEMALPTAEATDSLRNQLAKPDTVLSAAGDRLILAQP